jgi:hypothetical protein
MKTKPQTTSVEDHSDVIAKRAEITTVETRIRQAVQREAAARQRLRDLRPVVIGTADVAKQKASTADKVRKLLIGGSISSADPAAELEAAEREQSLLHNAQIELHDQLRGLIGEISDQYSIAHLAPLVRDDTVEIYEHLARAAAAMARVRSRTADALRLGYHVSSAHCPDLVPPVAWRLGDPSDTGSELWRMRQALVEKGWMK